MSICFAAHVGHAGEVVDEGSKWKPWFEFGGAYSNGDASRGELTLLAPLMQGHSSLVFADVRGKFFENDVREGNLALGWRVMSAGGWNFGAWGGFDIRRSESGNTFRQIVGGVEALHPDWDIRANVYLPISDEKQSPFLADIRLIGNQIIMIGGMEIPLNGVDAEIGLRVPLEYFGADDQRFELRLFGGGFYFDASDVLKEIAGPKARIEWRINDVISQLPRSRLTFEGEFQYDQVRDDRYEVGAKLRIPLGSSDDVMEGHIADTLSAQERRMVEGLERDTDIVTAQSKAEAVVDNITDVDFDRVAYADGSTGLASAFSQGGNTLVIAQGGAGDIGGGETMQGDQTLVGGAGAIRVRGRKSGTIISFQAPGSRPTISEAVNAVLTVANNSHVAHIDLVGNGGATLATNDGIIGASGQRVVIDGVNITGIGDNGIRFLNDNTVTISDVVLRDIDDEGIDFSNDNIVSISNVVVANANGSGIQFSDRNNVMIDDALVTGAGGEGIDFEDDNEAVIRNVTISDAASDGIEFEDNNRFSIIGGRITNSGDQGIDANSNNTAIISGLDVLNSTNAGIRFNNDNVISISDGSVDGTGLDGILVESNNTLTINNMYVANVGHQAIDIHSNNILSISNTTFAGSMLIDVFEFDAAGNQVVNSLGNVNNTTSIGGRLCDTIPGADFTGTISFVDGVVLQDNVAPCN